ncbi:MAG: hypothetical protein CME26_07625 [Gemmatimonadetes bacterium]|nr:hypothetical protein [Gemmatimonadota bacterium]|tara:strand:+ start:2330 stop:2887 length:558 start_codon:yes stop_codon:yes gene_type:complete
MLAAEQKTIQQAILGNERAYSKLFREHRGRIAATIAQRTNDPDDVDNLVQQTFIRTFRALPRFRGDATFSTWLTRIALNACHSHDESRRTLVSLDTLDHGSEVAGRCPRPWPDQVLHQKEQVGRLVSEIDALPERYRKAIELHYLEDRPYTEVVDRLGIPPGTLKTWLHRSRNRVRESMEETDVL